MAFPAWHGPEHLASSRKSVDTPASNSGRSLRGAPPGSQRWGWRAVVWAPGSEQREGGVSAGQGGGAQPHSTSCSSRPGLDLVKTKTQQESAIGLGGLQGGCKLTSAPVHAPRSLRVRSLGGSTPAAGGLRGAPVRCKRGAPRGILAALHTEAAVSLWGAGGGQGRVLLIPEPRVPGLERALLGAQDTARPAPGSGWQAPHAEMGFLPSPPRAAHQAETTRLQTGGRRGTAGRGAGTRCAASGSPAAPGTAPLGAPPPPQGPGSQRETASQRL